MIVKARWQGIHQEHVKSRLIHQEVLGKKEKHFSPKPTLVQETALTSVQSHTFWVGVFSASAVWYTPTEPHVMEVKFTTPF